MNIEYVQDENLLSDNNIREIEQTAIGFFYRCAEWVHQKYGDEALKELNLALFTDTKEYPIIPAWYVRFNFAPCTNPHLDMAGYDFIWTKEDWRKK